MHSSPLIQPGKCREFLDWVWRFGLVALTLPSVLIPLSFHFP